MENNEALGDGRGSENIDEGMTGSRGQCQRMM